MSRETIDAARRVMAALGERDFSALVEMADPEVEWHSFFAELGEGGVYRGREGMQRYVDDLSEAWDMVSAEVDDAIAVGSVALLVGRIRYRGKASGLETATSAGWILKFRDGRVVMFRAFREPEHALEAIGLQG